MDKNLYIVMPVYNEEEIIEDSIKVVTDRIKNLIKNKRISNDSRIVIIDDGSVDKTFEIVKDIKKKNKQTENNIYILLLVLIYKNQ